MAPLLQPWPRCATSAGMEDVAYKILTAEQFAQLRENRFEGAPIDQADGYIHLSTAAQLSETAAKHFAGQTGLMVAAVDLSLLGAAIRWEISRNNALFPHLYGRLEPRHIIAACELEWRNGAVKLP